MPILDIQKVSKRFDKKSQVLSDIAISVQQGEIFALLGENGAGKTTLLKAVLDLIDIEAGEITINHQFSHRNHRARQGVAYLPEHFRPPHFLSGNAFIGALAEMSGVVVREGEVGRWCRQLELDNGALQYTIGRYSKGMAQKLGLIASIVCGHRLLLLDEPMSGLDAKARLLFKDVLSVLRDEGRSVLLSTHLLNDIAPICDRLGLLHQGQMAFVGSPDEFCRAYECDSIERAYLACLEGA